MDLLGVTLDLTVFTETNFDAHPVQIKFYDPNLNDSVVPYCVYWQPLELEWRQDGCTMVNYSVETKLVTCECNHLTSFGVLFGGKSTETQSQISIVIASISMACLLITNLVLHMGR